MKQISKPLGLLAIAISLLSCSSSSTLIPNYTSVEKLANLNPGMDKQQALSTLDNIYPFDILNGEANICEIHHYKYKHLMQKVNGDVTAEKNLRGGKEQYMKEKDAYIVYKNGVIYSIMSNPGKADFGSLMANLQNLKNTCDGDVLVKGCTDPQSLNYNPDAQTDDGSCQYCECGTVKNPNYNPRAPKSSCNSPCVSIESAEKHEEECGTCDILNALKGSNVTLNLNLDGVPQTGKASGGLNNLLPKKSDSKSDSNTKDSKSNTSGKGSSKTNTGGTIKVY